MKVDCNQCGAALTIGDATRFVTCAGCASRLEIMRSDGAIFTEVLEKGSAAMREGAARSDAEAAMSGRTSAGGAGKEALLYIIVGGLVIASDVYWWVTDPTMQSLFARVILLAAGFGVCVSGVWKLIVSLRSK